jgi:putative phosphoesterase
VKAAFISDLHANYEAVSALSPHLAAADVVVCLGDLLGYYCQVNEVMNWVREHVTICVLGNHDAYVLDGCPPDMPPAVKFGVEHAARVLESDHAAWLRALPLTWGGFLGGKKVLLAHGSPWNPMEDYLYADNPALASLSDFAFDIVAFGQTHRFIEKRHANALHLNPGSVGQSRDAATSGHAVAAIVDLDTLQVTRLAEKYDTAKVIGLAQSCGADEWIGKHLIS